MPVFEDFKKNQFRLNEQLKMQLQNRMQEKHEKQEEQLVLVNKVPIELIKDK
ncbi:MAG: hypothetical protein IPK91_10325 [Saprospiraceae bacterium]|nr:hypothetical protein [Saprospiraceae bacterium]